MARTDTAGICLNCRTRTDRRINANYPITGRGWTCGTCGCYFGIAGGRITSYGRPSATSHPQCLSCRNYLSDWTCAAFPEGIPGQIREGAFIHTKPYPGDDGLMYQPFEDVPTELVEAAVVDELEEDDEKEGIDDNV